MDEGTGGALELLWAMVWALSQYCLSSGRASSYLRGLSLQRPGASPAPPRPGADPALSPANPAEGSRAHSLLRPVGQPAPSGSFRTLPKGAGGTTAPRREPRSWGEAPLDLLQLPGGPTQNRGMDRSSRALPKSFPRKSTAIPLRLKLPMRAESNLPEGCVVSECALC